MMVWPGVTGIIKKVLARNTDFNVFYLPVSSFELHVDRAGWHSG